MTNLLPNSFLRVCLYTILYITFITTVNCDFDPSPPQTNSISVIQVLAKDPKFTTTIKFLQKSRLIPYINRQSNVTLFTLDNDGWKKELGDDAYMAISSEPAVDIDLELQRVEDEDDLTIERDNDLNIPGFGKWTIPEIQDIVKYMLFIERRNLSEFEKIAPERKLVQSYCNFNSSLGLNRGQFVELSTSGSIPWTPKLYISGSQILSGDIQASNGVIHVLEKVIIPPPDILSVLKNFEKESRADISEIVKLIDLTSELTEDLRAPKPHTLFIFEDDKLQKYFQQVELNYLAHPQGLNDRKDFVSANLVSIADHIPIYTQEVDEKQIQIPAANNQTLLIRKDKEKNQWFVNDIPVRVRDILASNGVIHILEDVHSSENLKFDGFKYMIGLDASKFSSLMNQKYLKYFVTDPMIEHTILVVPDSAMNSFALPLPDSDELMVLMRYHVIQGYHSVDTLKSSSLINTVLADKYMDGYNQKIKVNSDTDNKDSVTFNNQAVVIKDFVTFGKTNFITISNLLTAPIYVLDLIARDSSLSSFGHLLRASGMEDELKEAKYITLFAPTNEAFAPDAQQLLMDYLLLESSLPILRQFIRYCIGTEAIYSPSIYEAQNSVKLTTLMDGQTVIVKKDSENSLVLQTNDEGKHYDTIPELSEVDLFVRSGVVHKTSSLLPPDTPNSKITLKRLLSGSKTTIFQNLLETAGMSKLLEYPPGSKNRPRTIIVPSDKAWANVNMTRLNQDTIFLKAILYFHFLNEPAPPRLDSISKTILISTMSWVLSTLKIVFVPHKPHTGPSDPDGVLKHVILRTQGAPSTLFNWMAHIIKSGQAADGSIVIVDSVLYLDKFPVPGLAWYTILLIILLILSVIGGGVYAYFKWYRPRQQGYEPIDD